MPSRYPDETFDRHGNRRDKQPIGGTLGRTLADYVSPEDAGLTREEFLRAVADRIKLDFLGRTVNPENDNAEIHS